MEQLNSFIDGTLTIFESKPRCDKIELATIFLNSLKEQPLSLKIAFIEKIILERREGFVEYILGQFSLNNAFTKSEIIYFKSLVNEIIEIYKNTI
jgi:hypothetical protein